MVGDIPIRLLREPAALIARAYGRRAARLLVYGAGAEPMSRRALLDKNCLGLTYGKSIVTLRRKGRSIHTLLHEMAHVIAPRSCLSHDRFFVAVYCDLLADLAPWHARTAPEWWASAAAAWPLVVSGEAPQRPRPVNERALLRASSAVLALHERSSQTERGSSLASA